MYDYFSSDILLLKGLECSLEVAILNDSGKIPVVREKYAQLPPQLTLILLTLCA
jgi:hypothetical protein